MRSSRFFLPMAHWFHGGAGPNSPFSFHRNLHGEVCFGATQASVTALSITCRWTLLHSGQVNVRKSWPARFNRRQPHWRTASRALRTLVLCVEHVSLPQFGALSSPASHPTEADFMGSLATTSFCTKWHLGHSNRRCSKPMGPGLMRASIMPDVQREQCGRSMRENDGPEKK